MIPLRKTAEIIMALYVLGFAAFVAVKNAQGVNALEWAGMTQIGALQFAWFCLGASLVHAFGIWLNGSFRWSPFIRAAGLLLMSMAVLRLAWIGVDSTAGYTYLSIFSGFFWALKTAMRDCVIALRGHHGTAH